MKVWTFIYNCYKTMIFLTLTAMFILKNEIFVTLLKNLEI